jgi:hypothetical protein
MAAFALSSLVFNPSKGQIKIMAETKTMASAIDEKKLMRKIDWHVIPWLGFLYLLSFLDRGSIGNAKVSFPAIFPQVNGPLPAIPFHRRHTCH